MKLRKIMSAGFVCLNLISAAHANSIAPLEISPVAPPQLEKLIQNNVVSVVETFTHETLTGWLVESAGEYHLYWETKEGYVVAGPMIDSKGYNLTARYLEEKKPTKNFDNPYNLLASGDGYFSTQEDASDGELYVFIEPFCGWCSKLHEELKPFVAEGLKVNWVPVSFLSAKSPGVIEYIMNSDNPATALDLHEKYKNTAKASEFISIASSSTKAMLKTNSQLMSSFDIKGTPGLVYKIDGKVMTGGYMPSKKLSELVQKLRKN